MTNFADTDIKQITEHGLTVDEIEQQIKHFKSGFPFANIVRPATSGDGICEYNSESVEQFIKLYDDEKENYHITKFVPASGAATRMFRDLFDFLTTNTMNTTTKTVIDNITRFAFYEDLKQILPEKPTARDIVSAILDSDKLNMGTLPKALIKFHKYKNESRTAAHEHLIEGTQYATTNDTVNIHFTLSPEHTEKFKELMQTIVPTTEQKHNVRFNITTSVQSPNTDTIAVNFDNTPFRDDNGKLVFRPSGHGALIENLNKIDSDIIFIKNIDNITNDTHRADTIKYKKLLAGILISIQKRIKQFMSDLENNNYNEAELNQFITTKLNETIPQNPTSQDYIKILNRPIRVCGMVPNTGAPGGGPFWVRDTNGIHLQITESSQIAPDSRDIMNKSTHFNPVDLVCFVRDWRGNKFNLTKFLDENTGFISEKSYNGHDLRAMERPGLWNGAMAHWITVFVTTPNTTFTPVKKVSDLLDTAHI
ncbi:MAG: DUF4301 family protein [Proteobacteria bacterium]|nr:DUF4301 family protein [Candidatus Enterousia onthequi]